MEVHFIHQRLFCYGLQYDQSTHYVRGSEDCLVVSIYTPELPAKDEPLLPVLVWLHGAGVCKVKKTNKKKERDRVSMV